MDSISAIAPSISPSDSSTASGSSSAGSRIPSGQRIACKTIASSRTLSSFAGADPAHVFHAVLVEVDAVVLGSAHHVGSAP
ncbi:hypothetical protein [Streptomyces rishiriensis]|uniref:hypothetical protein n=1 Tax=Streptomyces rishiriensis TaxID=68264 RepID=UPI00131ED18C|nr:hypothetical protein [Streptomyces rishiriensis]